MIVQGASGLQFVSVLDPKPLALSCVVLGLGPCPFCGSVVS